MESLKIGTRSSKLAVWQAEKVQHLISETSNQAILVPVESHGDIDLQTPIYELGIQGVFTKTLDIALLNNQVDIAVHSYKDVPTKLADGLTIAAVLKRDNPRDLLVSKNKSKRIERIATSSIRRKAQWLNKFPDCEMFNVRGNVQTRLRKFSEENWDAIIFSAAGLERLDIVPEGSEMIDWMLPAPAQGVVVVICRENDQRTREICTHFHHRETDICTAVERDFLSHLYGGCSAPIGAFAEYCNGKVHFNGVLLSLDGKTKLDIKQESENFENMGYESAQKILQSGGAVIINELRSRQS